MNNFPLLFPTVGTASSATDLFGSLGQRAVLANGKRYRLCRAAAAITAAAGKILVSAVDATTGERTWVVNTTTTVNDPLIAGVIPGVQAGTASATALASGDYFLLQVGGDAQCLVGDNSAGGEVLATSTTAGVGVEIGNATTFLQIEMGAAYAVVIKGLSSATTNANALTACRLINLD